jgi:hypothetical protein
MNISAPGVDLFRAESRVLAMQWKLHQWRPLIRAVDSMTSPSLFMAGVSRRGVSSLAALALRWIMRAEANKLNSRTRATAFRKRALRARARLVFMRVYRVRSQARCATTAKASW